MPTAKCKPSSTATDPMFRLAMRVALLEKGYKRFTAGNLANLLDITIADAVALSEGRIPSLEAIKKVSEILFDNAEQSVIYYAIEPWPVMNFSFRRAPHATRI